ncbi:uncharacterized protein A1O9_00013 [Exophiala aquamarina CBS 119918]|uniref:Carboxylic ester hydrolase n=1 Tax=Exophiala aquamarina CBS 119918 TaxID=1182545 RepID=A0A072PQ84_9EURO|nr:uncharacterized protein A1O9_00013 [Exophiala aquamarina CBS 119918]KEF62041.1 hypothetical protein A1O9_00013 [Exophiala aquamarina CBS 119918]
MASSDTTTIRAPAGPCLVKKDDNLILAHGIPYAHASRFEQPGRLPPWTNSKDCRELATICPQLPSRLESVALGPITANRSMDEDCLHLTIISPENASHAPVMVWLHGGAFISGSGDLDCYAPISLARDHGVVCVNVSYRLGVFGYLMIPGIAPANLGLLDQRAALQWIQANISSFGGDPSRVTVVGQSAGADSIVCLLASDDTEGLFHRAILMSPPLREIRDRIPTIALLARKAASLLTVDPREMSTSQLLDLQKSLLMDPVKPQIMLFGPALGHYPLPLEAALDRRLSSRLRDVPVMIGWTEQDGRPFARWMGPLRSLYPFPGIGRILESLGTWWVTRSYFAWPAQAFRKQVEDDAGGRATSYEFKWHPDGNEMQANHCIDIPFILGRPCAWRGAPMLMGPESQEQLEKLGQHMRHLYAGFIQGYHPKPGHLVIGKDFECSYSLWQ